MLASRRCASRCEHLVAALAVRLGLIHRGSALPSRALATAATGVGVVDLGRRGPCGLARRRWRRRHRHPDRDAARPAMLIGSLRGGERRARPPGAASCGLVEALQQQRELVASEARHRVAFPHAARQPVRHRQQHASPPSCPKRSLTGLKSSRSQNSTATMLAGSASLRQRGRVRCRKTVRLASRSAGRWWPGRSSRWPSACRTSDSSTMRRQRGQRPAVGAVVGLCASRSADQPAPSSAPIRIPISSSAGGASRMAARGAAQHPAPRGRSGSSSSACAGSRPAAQLFAASNNADRRTWCSLARRTARPRRAWRRSERSAARGSTAAARAAAGPRDSRCS